MTMVPDNKVSRFVHDMVDEVEYSIWEYVAPVFVALPAFAMGLLVLTTCILSPWVQLFSTWVAMVTGLNVSLWAVTGSFVGKVALSGVGFIVGVVFAIAAFFIVCFTQFVILGLAIIPLEGLRYSVDLILKPFLPGGVWNRRWRNPNREVRIAEVCKITNQALLARITRNDSDPDVRRRAVQGITDLAVLGDLLKCALHDDIHDAVKRRHDELYSWKLRARRDHEELEFKRRWSGRWMDGGP